MTSLRICLLIALFGISSSCSRSRMGGDQTLVEGDIEGLPRGRMVLIGKNLAGYPVYKDSSEPLSGKFRFNIDKKRLPLFLELEFHTSDGIKMLFSFKTKKTFQGGQLQMSDFLSDDTVLITGSLKQFIPKDFSLPTGIQIVYPTAPIAAGRQTEVMYSLAFDFNQPVTTTSFAVLCDLVRKYDYSYYLLSEIYINRGNFSHEQRSALIGLFSNEVQENSFAMSLKETNDSIGIESLADIRFIRPDDSEVQITFREHKLTMVVLWASWCGPCRQEIPDLKKVYNEFCKRKDFAMVSISLDQEPQNWKDALIEEDISWQNILLPPKFLAYSSELFRFNGAIPTTIFVDNNGDIVQKITGYSKSQLGSYREIIRKYIKGTVD